VLGTIIKFLPSRSKWTVEEIKQQVAGAGVHAAPKEVYNALGYLTRKKYVKRVGYGRYLVDGGLLVTADDLGVEPMRNED